LTQIAFWWAIIPNNVFDIIKEPKKEIVVKGSDMTTVHIISIKWRIHCIRWRVSIQIIHHQLFLN